MAAMAKISTKNIINSKLKKKKKKGTWPWKVRPVIENPRRKLQQFSSMHCCTLHSHSSRCSSFLSLVTGCLYYGIRQPPSSGDLLCSSCFCFFNLLDSAISISFPNFVYPSSVPFFRLYLTVYFSLFSFTFCLYCFYHFVVIWGLELDGDEVMI